MKNSDQKNKNILIVSDRSDYFYFLGTVLEKWYRVYYIAVSKRDEDLLKSKGIEFISFEEICAESANFNPTKVINQEEVQKILIYELAKDKIFSKGLKRQEIIMSGERYYNFLDNFFDEKKINLEFLDLMKI